MGKMSTAKTQRHSNEKKNSLIKEFIAEYRHLIYCSSPLNKMDY